MDPLEELEQWLGLHERAEILYRVDCYAVRLTTDDGDRIISESEAPTILQAISAAVAGLNER